MKVGRTPQAMVVAISLALVFLLAYLVTEDSSPIATPDPSLKPTMSFNLRTYSSKAARAPPEEELHPEVKKLVRAIKEATRRAAAAGDAKSYTDDEREAWNAANSCRSRRELAARYGRRKHVHEEEEGLSSRSQSNRQWDQVLKEYSELHRTCMRAAGNLTDDFVSRRTRDGCKFLVADVMAGAGLGNKVLVVASNILYAVLTQRVILVPTETLLPLIFCEPFSGSSWRVDNSTIPYPPLLHPNLWQLPRHFYRDLDLFMNQTSDNSPSSSRSTEFPPYASAVTYVSGKVKDQWHPRERFFCDREQEHYGRVPWLYATGCLYTLPNLFAIRSFRPTLEALFPDRMALTHLLRSVMLPDDTVWDRTTRIDDAYLAHADRRVGVQVRYKDGAPQYEEMNDVVNERITRCAVENRILPEIDTRQDDESDVAQIIPPARGEGATRRKNNVVTVFIACLYTGLHEHLSGLYVHHPTAGRNVSVGLVQVSHVDRQEFGLEVDRQALAEVLCLSFSDQLLVTPVSTYGGLAQAYGALKPWFIEIRPESDKACTRGVSVDVCYQGGLKKYWCPHDPQLHGQRISRLVPYLKKCIVEDYAPGGVQLITSPSPLLGH